MKMLSFLKRRKALSTAAAGLLLLALTLALGDARGGVSALSAALVTDNDARVSYLQGLGWEVDPQPLSREEIVIPREFGDVFENYNALQKQQGFDLGDYRGMTCTLYVYEVLNWPDGSLTVLADLYVFQHRVIGGDIHATALGGFMVGIK